MVPLKDGTTQYRQWYAAEPDCFPLFHSPWWLDAVLGPTHWRAIGLGDKQGNPLVFMPITYRKKWGLTFVDKPPLTPYLGPLWCQPQVGLTKLNTLSFLAKALPYNWYFRTTLRPDADNALPFAWAGYRLNIRYTYRIAYDCSFDVFSAANRSARKNMRSGLKKYQITQEWEPGILYDHLQAIFDRQGQPNPVSLSLIKKISMALDKHNCGKLLIARDQDGEAQSSRLVAWDSTNFYLIATGTTNVGRRSNANYALLGALPNFMPDHPKVLDFCGGGSLPGVARRNLGLGARAVAYLELKESIWNFLFK